MKKKANIRQKRDAETQRRKEAYSPRPAQAPVSRPVKAVPARPIPRPIERLPEVSPEEETREFMEYLNKYGVPDLKEDLPQAGRKKSVETFSLPQLYLKADMPIVSEALSRLHIGLQEMRSSGIRVVKLIHGYGSTGRGGKIRIGVREELAVMKHRKQIKDFIIGEEFGPTDQASRNLVERNANINRDPDYGEINHGITIVVL